MEWNQKKTEWSEAYNREHPNGIPWSSDSYNIGTITVDCIFIKRGSVSDC